MMMTFNRMKRILLFALFIGLVFSGCKSKKQLPQSQYTAEPKSGQKVFTVPETTTQEVEKETPPPAEVKKEEPKEPVMMRKEQVSFTSNEDKNLNERNNFFVILGSFSYLDNAKNFRTDLLDQGFTPIILHSETGYYRVCVNSYQNEADARNRVADIRSSYPKYADVWLLIKD